METQKEVCVIQEDATESNALVAHRFQKGANGQNVAVQQGKKDWKDWKKEKYERRCDVCKAKGHVAEQCFKVIGYPEWYTNLKNSKNGNGQATGTKFRLAANVHCDQETPLDVADQVLSTEMMSSICQEVVKAIKNKEACYDGAMYASANFSGKSSFSLSCSKISQDNNMLWIVDLGASDHMVFDFNILFNKRKLNHVVKVGLSDGTYKLVQ